MKNTAATLAGAYAKVRDIKRNLRNQIKACLKAAGAEELKENNNCDYLIRAEKRDQVFRQLLAILAPGCKVNFKGQPGPTFKGRGVELTIHPEEERGTPTEKVILITFKI